MPAQRSTVVTKSLLTLVAVLVMLGLVRPAEASVGHLKLLLDSTYTLDESWDAISGDDYLIGGGLRLEFDVALGFSLGIDYTYASASGLLFNEWESSYALHSPKLVVGWRWQGIDWFEPYVMAVFGLDFHQVRLSNYQSSDSVDTQKNWVPALGALAGIQLMLREQWLEKWKVWPGFSLGVFVEAGYLYRWPVAVSHPASAGVNGGKATVIAQKLGELKTGGPMLRGGIVWRF